MIFLRAGGQWLFEKPASLSPVQRLSLFFTCLFFAIFTLPFPPSSSCTPLSTVAHPTPLSPDTERAVIMETSRSPPPVSPAKLCALGGN